MIVCNSDAALEAHVLDAAGQTARAHSTCRNVPVRARRCRMDLVRGARSFRAPDWQLATLANMKIIAEGVGGRGASRGTPSASVRLGACAPLTASTRALRPHLPTTFRKCYTNVD
jgi:hypothetical protein